MIVGTQGFYGIPQLLTAQGGADVVVTAGAAATVASIGGASGAFVQAQPGIVVPILQGILTISLGATAPGAMVISFATTSGTAIDSMTVSPTVLVANANLQIPISLIGVAAQFAWLTGLTPLVQVNPTGQNVTVRLAGSRVLFGLYPGGA